MLEMFQRKLQLYVGDCADEIKYNEYKPKPQPMFLKPGKSKL